MMILGYLLSTVSAALFGYTLVVAFKFMLRWRVIRDRDGRKAAVLPLHIWVVAASYDLFLLMCAIQSAVYLRWWHPLIMVPALLLGAYAMNVLGRGQRRRPRESSD